MGLTPMMQQYLKIKDKYPDVLLFYRLGDFYEMFFDDAKTASKVLELTLTGKDCGLEERAPMCGVPYHAVDSYVARLIEAGYKVAICEQLSEPGKGLVERDIVRVITAGTVVESEMLNETSNNYLMSSCCIEDKIGVAWVDISTGEFNHIQFDRGMNVDLNELLSRIKPAEIICNEEMFAVSIELSVVKYGNVCAFTLFDAAAFGYDNALKKVKEQFDESVVNGIVDKSACICAVGALLEYLAQTQRRTLGHIKKTEFEDLSEFMLIDSNARRTLELTESNSYSRKKSTLFSLLNKTCTSMGARKLRSWIELPLIDSNRINSRLDGIEELYSNGRLRSKLKEQLDNIRDIERICARISCGGIGPKECIALAISLLQLPNIQDLLKGSNSLILQSIYENIEPLDELANIIIDAIDDQAPNTTKDGGFIKIGYDKVLDDYRTINDDAVTVLAEMEAREKQETGIRNLKIKYNKVFGYYIEVTKSQTSLVPFRYIRKQTTVNGERYITEELKKLETKILHATELAMSREKELYAHLIECMKSHIDSMLSTSKAIATLDCLLSNATIASEYKYVRPLINDDINHIKITDGRHPIVEQLLTDEEFVPNNTYMDDSDDRISLITGPNMAGKSIYMRQVAIIVIMAHIGFFVPARNAEICITDKIFTRVGASDDLNTGRSTFMVEMSEVSYIMRNATDRSLILLDEIGRGTSTYDGLSIAWSILEYLSENLKAKTLFSTHYHELTELEGKITGIKNYKLTVRELSGSIVFLRKLLRGSANRSFGIEVAGLAGLPNNILTRAKELLKKLENSDLARQTRMASNEQLSIFNSDSSVEINKILHDIDMDNVSPRTAYDILYDLKEKAEKYV